MISADQLTSYYDGKNMAMFDHQAQILTTILMTIVEMTDTMFPSVKEGMFHTMRALNHPSVEACTDSLTCGPFQMFWETYIMIYNDATATQ